MTQDRGALWLLIAGAAFISTTSTLAHASGLPPTASAFWRMALGGMMLAGFLLLAREWKPVRARDLAWMCPPALAFALDLWLWHRSIEAVGPGLSTLLANFQVFVMALVGVWLYGERLGPRFLAGLGLAFAGLWLLVGQGWAAFDPAYRGGVWMGLAAGVAYAAYMLVFRHAQRGHSTLPASQLLAICSLLCALALGLVGRAEGVSFAIPGLTPLGFLLALALFGQCLGWWFISRAMPRLDASVVGLVLLLQPALAFLQDVAFFDRATRPVEWAGLLLSLAGIFIGSSKARPAEAKGDRA